MKKTNRYFAGLVSLCMLLGMFNTSVIAETSESKGRELVATEVEDTSRLTELETVPHELQGEAPYEADQVVTVIVEMEAAPVMEYYGDSSYFSVGEGISSGEAVSKFLSSDEAKVASGEILSSQENVISNISTLMKEKNDEISRQSSTFEVINNWTSAINAMAIRIPYGAIDEVSKLDGVKRAYVEHIYERPEPIDSSVVEDGKGTYSYSYDMVGIEETWSNGYTGKEMLVAVLDTGLDIKMDNKGIITRTHEGFTDDSFKSGNPTDGVDDWDLRYTDNSLEEFLRENQLNSTTGNNGNHITYENNALYKNLKVPYACDYADGDIHVFGDDIDHGTHVTGTIAGFADTNEGEVKFSGVSPDAQVLFMKVFSNTGGGAQESVIINALEDALKLGADMINLSLGSDNGFEVDDTTQNDLYERVNNAGIVLMTSAGNSGKSSANNNYDSNTLTSNPDESMMSSPAVYSSNLGVASIDNTISVQQYLTWNQKEGEERKVYFNDPWSVAMKASFSDKEYSIYAIDGVGTYNDFYNAGFNNGYNNGKTGLALVKRGDISFAEKVNNAMMFSGVNSQGERYGVLGVIIYDNNPDGTELTNMNVAGTGMSSAFISGKDGFDLVNALEKGDEVKIKVSEEDDTVENATAGEMSSFSSWGAGPGLELKPEITAPGGNIWSTLVDQINRDNEGYTGSYGMMSGTSMAAPHMTGIGALIRQRVLSESAFNGIASKDIGDVVSQLLVSTAIPQKDGNGVYYSPRQQGAGLTNAAAASSTPAYITVDGENVGKLELGDDPERKGVLDINFNLNNTSDSEVKYNVEAGLMTPGTSNVSSPWGERNVISDSDTLIKTVSLGEVSVAVGSTTVFNQSVSLTTEEKANLDSIFENGTYVEGYVILTDATDSGNPQLGLPMLSFYGDWTKAPIFDSNFWIDEPEDGEDTLNNETSWYTSVVGTTLWNDIYGIIGFFDLGQNVFDPTSTNTQRIYKEGNITLSPDGNEYFDRIDNYSLYQLRDARLVVVEAKDAETGEVYMREWTSYSPKTIYNPNYSVAIPFSIYGTFPTWDGTDAEGNVLPSGTKCTYTITAYGDGEYGEEVFNGEIGREVTDFDSIIPGENEPTFNGHKMDMSGDVITFPVTIDTVAPKLQNNAVSFYEEDGRTYITGKVYDEDGSLASVEIVPYVTRSYKEGYGDPSYSEVGIDRNNPFYTNHIYDESTKEFIFTADVTEYVHSNESYPGENNYYDYKWNGNILLSCGDYGANDRGYAINVDATSGIVLSQTSALLKPGQQFELSVNNNTGNSDVVLKRTSSNPEIATVDEYGRVVAIAPGQTIITVSDGVSSAVCIVAVEEKKAEITDFDLSIDSFSGIKPDGQVVVNVDNIQPADAEIKNISWSVSEDEDYANDYGAGLITVGKNSSDSLSGFLYLTLNYSEDVLPAGHAVLTVTLDGIERTMDIDWDQIYQSRGEDDLIAGGNYNEQVHYVTQGETATLLAKYRQPTMHQVGDVLTEFTGLKLDGADFFSIGGTYQGKLINDEGYALPSAIKIYTIYSDGYKHEMVNNPYYQYYTYDSTTGEISIKYAPTGAENKLLIEAAGVESEGAPAGTMSDKTYTRPDKMFGPFDWSVTSGNGLMETGETNINGQIIEAAEYTPAEPGISYITATTKDGKYHVNFAVVSEPVLADKVTLDTNKIEVKVGETANVKATLSPTPTKEKDEELVWKSFNPEVATVSEDGTITGVSNGYAYIKVASKINCKVKSYCIVKVEEESKSYNVTFKDYDGTILKEERVKKGDSAAAPEEPKREGYIFIGWDISFENVTEDLVVIAQYKKIGDPEEKSYTVIFKGHDGTILKEEIVKEGNSAVPPAEPKREGYIFTGWDISFENVTEDLVVTAQYKKIDNPSDPDDGSEAPTVPSKPGTGGGGSNGSSSNNNLPKTGGDSSSILMMISSALCSLSGVALLRRKKEEDI